VAQTSSNFDPRQLFSDVINFVRERAQSSAGSSSPAQPSQSQLEIAVLSAISTESLNASAIKDAVAIASGGALAPSASEVRSTLDVLVESAKAEAETKGDRKVFGITKAGKAFWPRPNHFSKATPRVQSQVSKSRQAGTACLS